MNKETSKQARIINDALIAEYRQAVTKFNEEIKKNAFILIKASFHLTSICLSIISNSN